MKLFTLNTILLLLQLYSTITFAQCPENIELVSQKQIDEFALNYPNCTEIEGTLLIEGINLNSIVNLLGLKQLKSIKCLVIKGNNDLLNLQGLENVNNVKGGIEICNNGSLVNLTGLESIQSTGHLSITRNRSLIELSALKDISTINNNILIQSNKSLTSLGLENLIRIGGFFTIQNNASLIDLNGLENLEIIGGNFQINANSVLTNLSSLENLNEISGSLFIGKYIVYYGLDDKDGNHSLSDISGLKNLSILGGSLQIYDNISLTNLAGLEGIQEIKGDCIIEFNDSLVNISALNVRSVDGEVSIGYNLALSSLSGLDQLSNINGSLTIISNDNLANLNSLINLSSINGFLYLDRNDILNDISGLGNITGGISAIIITLNDKLSNCSIENLCNFLAADIGYQVIDDNAEGCNDKAQMAMACDGFAQIKSQIFYDVNQNQIKEENEPLMQSGSVTLDPGSVNVIQNSSNGYGIYYVVPGEYTVSLNEASLPQWNSTNVTSSYMLNLAEGACDTVLFGVYPKEIQTEIQTYINAPVTRCNDTIAFTITAKNSGTSFADGTLWFEADTNSTAVAPFIDEPDTLLTPSRFGWFYNDLPPSYTLSKQINLRIPGPRNFEVGDSLLYKSFSIFNDENGLHQSDSLSYKTELRCSYDPNDKLVQPERTCNYTLLDEAINYTIRFQNTGNDVALKVVVTDLLDVNLDASTFQLIGSSHLDVLNTSITSRGLLTFEFNEINLPDSTSNVQESQGYVSYTIKAKSNVEEYTLIENSANIFFDYNPPITTNTVQNVMVSSLYSSTVCLDADGDGLGDPNQSMIHCGEPPMGYVNNCSDNNDGMVGIEENGTYASINIYPNPNNGIFKIEGIESDKISIEIYNSLGHQITNVISINPNNNFINFRHLSNGIYYVYIQLEKQVIRKKLVVLN